jgi:hypothetical protein
MFKRLWLIIKGIFVAVVVLVFAVVFLLYGLGVFVVEIVVVEMLATPGKTIGPFSISPGLSIGVWFVIGLPFLGLGLIGVMPQGYATWRKRWWTRLAYFGVGVLYLAVGIGILVACIPDIKASPGDRATLMALWAAITPLCLGAFGYLFWTAVGPSRADRARRAKDAGKKESDK